MKGTNIERNAIVALCVSLVAGTGYVYVNRDNINYEPQSAREFRKNQVLFDNDTNNDSQGKTNENSKLWEKDEQSQNEESLQKQTQTDYLFKTSTPNKTIAVNDTTSSVANTESQNQNTTNTNQNSDVVYDIKDSNSSASSSTDTVIEVDGNGENTNTSSKNEVSGKDDSSKGDTSKDDVDKPGDKPFTPSPAPAPSKPDSGNTGTYVPNYQIKDPTNSKKNNPGDAYNPPKPYVEGNMKVDGDANDPNNASVYIRQGDFSEDDYSLYEGQSITGMDVFNSLYTYVLSSDKSINVWNEKDYDKYIRVDSVSFDGGNSWHSFPVTIPSDLSEDMMKIKVSWRLKTSGSWLERVIDYVPKKTIVYILSQEVDANNPVIDTETVLNSNLHPEIGDSIWMYYQPLNYIVTRNDWLDENNELKYLISGWKEEGKAVGWNYPVTAGKHVLQPDKVVEVPEGYHISLDVYWMNPDYVMNTEDEKLTYLQTLKYCTGEAEGTVITEDGVQSIIRVPEYVQAISMDPFMANCYDQMEIPKSVIYVDTDSAPVCVYDRFIVDPDNPVYSSNEEGLLLNKAQDEIIAIPSKLQEIHVGPNIKKVNFGSTSSVNRIYLHATSFEELPEIDYSKLSDMTIYLDSSVFDEFVDTYSTEIQENQLQVARISEPDKIYNIEEGLLLNDNCAYKGFFEGDEIVLSNQVTAVEKEAFASLDATTLILSLDGSNVTFKKDSLKNSNVSTIVCSSSDQMNHVLKDLKQAGKEDVEVVLSSVSQEGYQYYKKVDIFGIEDYVLLKAEHSSEIFDGYLTTEEGAYPISEVAANAFRGNQDVKIVTLPYLCTKIGAYAFYDCPNLEGMLIDSRSTITIGNHALDNNGLRFVGSNAQTGIFEDGYNPAIGKTGVTQEAQRSFFYVPTGSDGYASNCTQFGDGDGVAVYRIIDDQYLYGCDANGTPWLLLRAGNVEGDLKLPETTIEMFQYAFSNNPNTFTVNFEELNLDDSRLFIDAGVFYQTGLSGDLFFPQSYILFGDYAFGDCENILSVMNDGLTSYNAMVFSNCTNLQSVVMGEINGSLMDNLFYGCDALKTITMNGTAIPSLSLYDQGAFQFNHAWSDEEEAENLTIVLGDYLKSLQNNLIKKWRYTFLGYYDFEGTSAYVSLWNNVYNNLIDWSTGKLPENEEVDAEVKDILLERENLIRRLLKIDTVEEPLPYAIFDVDENGYISMRGFSGNIEELTFEAADLGMPDGWYPDYVEPDALKECKDLSQLYFSSDTITLKNNVLRGVESDSVSLVIYYAIPLLQVEEEGTPYSFGIDDTKVIIQNYSFGTTFEDFFELWKYPLAGYNTEESFAEAMKTKLIETGVEETNPEFEEKLQELENTELQKAEERLRAMFFDPFAEFDTGEENDSAFEETVQSVDEVKKETDSSMNTQQNEKTDTTIEDSSETEEDASVSDKDPEGEKE